LCHFLLLLQPLLQLPTVQLMLHLLSLLQQLLLLSLLFLLLLQQHKLLLLLLLLLLAGPRCSSRWLCGFIAASSCSWALS